MTIAHQTFVTFEGLHDSVPEQRKSGIVSELLGGRQLILSRRLCSFKSKVIEGQEFTTRMASALVLETLAYSSFSKTGIYITCVNGMVNIWTWDISQIEKLTDLPVRHAVPETLFHTPMHGFSVRACLEGYEGQFWENGVLRSSRWWAELPSVQAWNNFVRAGGGNFSDQVQVEPDSVVVGFEKNAKIAKNRVPLAHRLRQFPLSIGLWVGAAFLSVIVVFFIARNIVVEVERQKYVAEKSVLDEATREKRELRRQLISNEKELDTYYSLVPNEEPISAITSIFEILTDIGAEVLQIELSESRIEVRFNAEGKWSQRDLVQQLEASDYLEDASVSRVGLTGIWVVSASMGGANE